ncbi:MAG: ATP phosphoribosyltransferase regulatory subunit, partial [Chloroflexi bacterium]|nr:ATP phosphoribosyltransferase regulatory subunit [Chloroflexota bacterium]
MQPPQRLRGMEDSGPEVARAMTRVGQALADLLAGYGYLSVDVPVLEATELFLRKSGGELASRMYTFVDPGGHRVSIRPEFTSSVVRAYLEGLNPGPLPQRWQYQGPVVRYERDVEGSRRQHTQVGAELIGASGPWADAEVLALACKGLSSLGISGHSLVVGHLGFIGALLESLGLSDRARLFLLASVSSLKEEGSAREEVYRRARSLGLLPVEGQEAEPPSALAGEEAMAFLKRLAESDAPAVGVRGPEEIRERYMRKQRQPDDPARFSDALDTVARVVRVQGRPEEAVRQVRGLITAGVGRRELDSLEEGLEALSGYDLQAPVTLDFGLARG